jgi:hypothetical protein
MAIPSTAVFECRSTGYDYNGGGFNSAIESGVDYTQQDEAQVVFDNVTNTLTVHSTTTMVNISGSYNVSGFDNGNCVYISGGGATPGRYFISASDSGNKRWTLDRAAGTAGQVGMGRMGGANKFPGSITNVGGTTLVAGNLIWIKTGIYVFDNGALGPSGTCNFNPAGKIEGYENTRGDGGTPPTFVSRLNGGTLSAFGHSAGVSATFKNLKVVRESGTTLVSAFSGGSTNVLGQMVDLIASGCTSAFAQARPKNCYAIQCGLGFDACEPEDCGAYQCITAGFSQTGRFVNNSWAAYCSGDGFSFLNGGGAYNCTAYGNVGDGFDQSSTSTCSTITNCVSVANSGYAFNTSTTNGPGLRIINCAEYNNALGVFNTATPLIGQVASLSVDPFVDGRGLDFRPNNLTGGGVIIKGSGLGPYGQTSYRDVGAVQHYDGFLGTTVKGFMR